MKIVNEQMTMEYLYKKVKQDFKFHSVAERNRIKILIEFAYQIGKEESKNKLQRYLENAKR